jgi:hypothetical protein
MNHYKLDPARLKRYEYSIFEVCEKLHMSKTGAGDQLTENDRGRYIAALAIRISEWRTDPDSSTHGYDASVKNLIVATLKEQLK